MMRTLRWIMSWCFLAEAIFCGGWALWSLQSLLLIRDTAGSYALEFAVIAATAVFGLAAWALRREYVARKGWVIAASLLNLVVSTTPLLLYGWIRIQGIRVRPGLFTHSGRVAMLPMVFGILGLIVLPRERSASMVAPVSP